MSEPSIVAFLRARLDDDERIAEACGGSDAVWNRDCGHVNEDGDYYAPGECDCSVVEGAIHIYDEGGHGPEDAEHIARHNPARVLAEVAAKRELLRLHQPVGFDEPGHVYCNECQRYDDTGRTCPTMLLLVAPYRDHPDFDPAWTTEGEAT